MLDFEESFESKMSGGRVPGIVMFLYVQLLPKSPGSYIPALNKTHPWMLNFMFYYLLYFKTKFFCNLKPNGT